MAHLPNLKPWPKGVSGNPGGFRLPPELRQARRENMANLIKLIHFYVGATEEQVKERLAGPDATQLEEMIQGQIGKSKEGDPRPFQFLIELMCGKIPEADNETTATMTPKQKLETLKAAIAKLESETNE